jgi:hypothetical protein
MSNGLDSTAVSLAILEDLGVDTEVTLPEQTFGVYSHSRSVENGQGDHSSTCWGVLTSEGWIPPEPKGIIHTLSEVGEDANDISALRQENAGRSTKTVEDPRVFREEHSNVNKIDVIEPGVSVRSKYFGKPAFHFPKELSESDRATIISPGVKPSIGRWLDEYETEPDKDDLVGVLQTHYGVTEEVAEMAVDRRV